jgi:uncharacterized protein YecA (UPF0149 family)
MNSSEIKENENQDAQAQAPAHVHGPNCNHGHHDNKPIIRQSPKIGRNDPCFCGSEKKYKKCCGKS